MIAWPSPTMSAPSAPSLHTSWNTTDYGQTSAVLEDRRIGLHLRFSRYVPYVTWSDIRVLNTLTGAGHLLTDPQIMTSPYVFSSLILCTHWQLKVLIIFRSFGKFLFGDGNISEAFNDFPVQHICNKYCEWFKLPSLQSNPDAQAE